MRDPRVTEQIAGMLAKPGGCHALCDMLLFQGDSKSEDKMKLSYQVYTIFTDARNDVNKETFPGACLVLSGLLPGILQAAASVLLTRLITAIRNDFEGSLHHVLGVYDALFDYIPEVCYHLLLCSSKINTLMYIKAFANIITVPVGVASFLKFICPTINKFGSSTRMLYDELYKINLFQGFSSFICCAANSIEERIAMGEFFAGCIEALCLRPLLYGGDFVASIGKHRSCILELVGLLCDLEEPLSVRQAVISVFDTLIRLCKPATVLIKYCEVSGRPVKTVCPLLQVVDSFQEILRDAIPLLTVTLVASEKIARPEQPLTHYRFTLIRLLVNITVFNPENCLPLLSEELIVFMCEWFISSPKNNLYHCDFLKMFRVILTYKKGQNRLIETALDKCGILSYSIEGFQQRDKKLHDVRGHLLEILMFTRRMERSAEKGSFLAKFLEGHEGWNGIKQVIDGEAQVIDIWALETARVAFMKTQKPEQEVE